MIFKKKSNGFLGLGKNGLPLLIQICIDNNKIFYGTSTPPSSRMNNKNQFQMMNLQKATKFICQIIYPLQNVYLPIVATEKILSG
jgi:hypothetical protein